MTRRNSIAALLAIFLLTGNLSLPMKDNRVSYSPKPALAAQSIQPAAVSQAYNGGRIVFASSRDGRSQIYAMDPDGANQVNLSANSFDDSDPAISPDGKTIAFVSLRDGNQELYLMDANGGNQRRLTNTSGDEGSPSWSPDGASLVVHYTEPGDTKPTKLVIIAVPGGARTTLFAPGDSVQQPDWSPDGSRIAFFWDQAAQPGIYTISPSGGTPVYTNLYGQHPKWSPSGLKLAYVYIDPVDWNSSIVGVANSDGSAAYWVSPGITDAKEDHPVWSPDGRRILFDSLYMGYHQIYVTMADGSTKSNFLNLSASGASDWLPDWSAAGSVAAPVVFGSYVGYQTGGVSGPGGIDLYNGVTGQTTVVAQAYDLRLGGIWGNWVVYQQGNRYGGYDIWVYDIKAGSASQISTTSSIANQNRPFIDGSRVIWRQTSADYSNSSGTFRSFDLMSQTATVLNLGAYGPRYSRYAVGDGRLAFVDEYGRVSIYDLGSGAVTQLVETPALLGGIDGNMVAAVEHETAGNDLLVTYVITPDQKSLIASGIDGTPAIAGDLLAWTSAGSLNKLDLTEDISPTVVASGVSAVGENSSLITWLDSNGAWSASQVDAPAYYTGLDDVDGNIDVTLPDTSTIQTSDQASLAMAANPWQEGSVARVSNGGLSLVIRLSTGQIGTTAYLGTGEYIFPGYELYTGPYDQATLQFRDGSTLALSGGTYLRIRPYHITTQQQISNIIGSVFQSVDIDSLRQAIQNYVQDGSTTGTDANGNPTGLNLSKLQNDLTAIKLASKTLAGQARLAETALKARGRKAPTYLATTSSMLDYTSGTADRLYNHLNYLQAGLSWWKAIYLPWYQNALYDAFRDYFENIAATAEVNDSTGIVTYHPLDPDEPDYQNRIEVLFKMILDDGRTCFYEKNWTASFLTDGTLLLSTGSCGTIQWSKADIAKHVARADGQVLRSHLLYPLLQNILQAYQDTASILVPGEAQLILSLMNPYGPPQRYVLRRGSIKFAKNIDRARQRTPFTKDIPSAGVRVIVWGTAYKAEVDSNGVGSFFAEDGMPVLANTSADTPDAYAIKTGDGAIALPVAGSSGVMNIPGRTAGLQPLLVNLTPNQNQLATSDDFHFGLQFSAPMSTTTVTNFGTLTVTNGSNAPYFAGSLDALTQSWDSLGASLALTPTVAPLAGTYALTLTLPTSVVSAEGLSVGGAPIFTTTFTVGSEIGSAGGNAQTAAGTGLTIPPSALTSPTSISIAASQVFSVTSGWYSPDGLAYTFSPDGQTFSVPVTLTVAEGRAIDRGSIFYWTGSDWQNIGGAPGPDGLSVVTSIRHLSTYAVFAPLITQYRIYLPLALKESGP